MKKLAVIVVVLSGLIAAAGAEAAPFTPPLDRAYELASEHWGGPPSLCTSVDLEIVPDEALPPPGDGRVALGLGTVPAGPEPCMLYIARSLAVPLEYEHACSIIEHESGHNHGLGHSTDPADVMYPIPPVTRECANSTTAYFRLLNLQRRFRLGGPGHPRVASALHAASAAFWG